MPLPTLMEGAHHPIGPRDWEHYRETIERLYVTDDRSLPEVVAIMTSLHGFVATERQYKRRISDWHLDKNVKDEEMRAIIATEASRLQQGKRSVFYVRDRQVDSKKIDRFAQRKKIDKYTSAALAKSSNTSSSERAKLLLPAMSDIFQDELYSPSPVAPARPQHTVSSRMAVLQDRLQAAQQSHANLTPKSSDDESFSTAAQIRQREKAKSDLRALEQHVSRPPSSPPPRTVSPKEVALDYNEIEEDAKMPLFPQNNGSYNSSLPSTIHGSRKSRQWTAPADLSIEGYLLELLEWLQEGSSDHNMLSSTIARSQLPLFRDDFCSRLISLATEKSTRLIQDGKSYIIGEQFRLRCSGCVRTISTTTYLCSTCDDGYYNLCSICQAGNGPRDTRGHLLIRLDLECELVAHSVGDAWEYIVDPFAFENDDVNLIGVVHCWQRILPWLKRGYMLNQPLMRWSIKSNKVNRGAKGYSHRTTNPLPREMILAESWGDDATSLSNLRQESERINKDVDEVDILKHDMQTLRSDTTSQHGPASSTRRDERGPPPKQAKLASEQSKLGILSTIASVKESAETSSQLSSRPLSKGRFKSPFTEGASTPTPGAQGVSLKLMTQPSTTSASSHAKADEITRIMDGLEERLHSKKGSVQPHPQLSKSSSGISCNTSTTPVEPSIDTSGYQKDFPLRDRSHRIDLPDSSDSNHDPSSPDQAPEPPSETSLFDWAMPDGDLVPTRIQPPLFGIHATRIFSDSKFRWANHERPKALDKENYYASPIAVAISSLPASLRQRPFDMFYFRFFTDNTARLLVSHDCDSNGFRSIIPRSMCTSQKGLHIGG
ncbi:MAG: hypothetical protein Q9212_003560 [Teloschistes hypoglaucus]